MGELLTMASLHRVTRAYFYDLLTSGNFSKGILLHENVKSESWYFAVLIVAEKNLVRFSNGS